MSERLVNNAAEPVYVVPPMTEADTQRDRAMKPVMRTVGVPGEALQETHAWNVDTPPPEVREKLDDTLMVEVEGTYEGWVNKMPQFLQPLFMHTRAGWKDYVVLEAAHLDKNWHIGWIVENDDGIQLFQVSKLPLSAPQVRMLKGPKGTRVTFFALTSDGVQVPVRVVDSGTLGDERYQDTRLLTDEDRA